MDFTNTAPQWDAKGVEPTTDLKEQGFTAGYKPPADYFNYLFNKYTECIKELQEAAQTLETTMNGKAASNHTHSDYETTKAVVGGSVSMGLTNVEYTTQDVSDAFGDEFFPITTLNTHSTLVHAVKEVSEKVANMFSSLTTYFASKSHTHSQDEITGLSTALAGKAAISHTHSAYANKSIYGDASVSLGRNANTNVGSNSVAIGRNATASGNYSMSQGDSNNAAGKYGFACGASNTANGDAAFASGFGTTATDSCSHSEGYFTKALQGQHAQGHYNDTSLATKNNLNGTGTGTAFVIGNGTNTAASNAFRVNSNGVAMGKSSFASTGADYAEYFEWLDGNPENEDRVGYFVTFADGNLIKKATEGDYILGIVSGMPCVVGNNDECWMKQFETDEFGRFIYETHTEIDEKTGEEKEYTFYKINPDYDPEKPYTHREERPEWSAIGMIGVLSVYDDGTCQVNGYCKCTNNGIATAAEKGEESYRVIARVTENIVKVVLK